MYWTTRSRKYYGKSSTDYVVLRHPLRLKGEIWVSGVKFVDGYGVVERDSGIYRLLKRVPVLRKAKVQELETLRKVFRTKEVLQIYGKDIFYNYLEKIGLGPDLKPLNPETLPSGETPEKAPVVEAKPEPVRNVKPLAQVAKEDVKVSEEANPVKVTSEAEKKVETDILESFKQATKVQPSAIEDEYDLPPMDEIVEEEIRQELPELTAEEISAAYKLDGRCPYIKSSGDVCGNDASKASPSGHCFGHIRQDPQLKKN